MSVSVRHNGLVEPPQIMLWLMQIVFDKVGSNAVLYGSSQRLIAGLDPIFL